MTSNETVESPSWDLSIKRCEVLAVRYPFASEILSFYQRILLFQKELYKTLQNDKEIFKIIRNQEDTTGYIINPCILKKGIEVLYPYFHQLLSITMGGPPLLAKMAQEVSYWGPMGWLDLLEGCEWIIPSPATLSFFPRVLLQPYLQVFINRESIDPAHNKDFQLAENHCPFCGHRPLTGYLRPFENTSQRFLVCSLCNGEWLYRRLFCPNCMESDREKISYFVAEECPSARLELCDTCKRYIKTIDLGKDPNAIPLVDDIATIHLDVWARQKDYKKLELNLIGV